MPDLLLGFLEAHPWVVYVWLGASLLAIGLRAAWDVTEERPRWVKALLAITDLVQLNFSGPAKLIAGRVKQQ